MESRIVELETKLGFSEHFLEELSQTIYRQQRQIDQLQQDILGLRRQMEAGRQDKNDTLRDEIPPHY